MRLVDVDKFINDFPIRLDHYDEENGSKEFVSGIETVLGSLECTPTVEAIPIEFIKEQMESARYIWSNSDKNVELYWRGVYKGLMALIRNWEKENG